MKRGLKGDSQIPDWRFQIPLRLKLLRPARHLAISLQVGPAPNCFIRWWPWAHSQIARTAHDGRPTS